MGEKNIGEKCLAKGCVAYCGLWQMAQAATDDDMRLLLNVTDRIMTLVNNVSSFQLDVTAYSYTGSVWPHWATFQYYLPGGQHIMHPDTDKGEHCLSFTVSFTTHGRDFGGGQIQVFEC